LQGIIKLHEFLPLINLYMVLFKKATDLHKYLDQQRRKDKKIVFVPTMGALHEGHAFLIHEAGKESGITVCSIFVNPVQFNDPADFEKYPITIEKDIFLLETTGCDVLYLPSVKEIYPEGTSIKPHYNLDYLETILEGKYRPGHFQGVCAVVHRLLKMVKPDILYIGQKDYQQCLVIKKLVGQIQLSRPVEIKVAGTQRADDGLAMSSRNMRLNDDQRKKAPAIYQTLLYIKENVKPGDLSNIRQLAWSSLKDRGFKVDYVEIAAAKDLAIISNWDGREKLVVLAAAYLGDVRLIDNILLN
jgi:pantoate--beta-alanine ligase